MGLSILIPWADRPELAQTLSANAQVFAALEAEVLVANCGGDDSALARLAEAIDIPRLRVVECGPGPFNKCRAINIAAEAARGDLLFFLDADVVLDDALELPADLLSGDSFMTLEKVREAAGPPGQGPGDLAGVRFTLTLEFSVAEPITVETGRRHFDDDARSSPGLLLVSAADFRAVGGMDARMAHWGWEDLDLIVRLQHLLGRKRIEHGSAWHLTHGDERRNLPAGLSRAESERKNLNFAIAKYRAGDWLGTLAADTAV
jgi:glycosyltransferase involved in cell wall biosynthesis